MQKCQRNYYLRFLLIIFHYNVTDSESRTTKEQRSMLCFVNKSHIQGTSHSIFVDLVNLSQILAVTRRTTHKITTEMLNLEHSGYTDVDLWTVSLYNSTIVHLFIGGGWVSLSRIESLT